mmetsp:Transcript_150462/g.273833  ORF Transcript_150462/g.273833 Transcript_150462/m.273833 type:complete len:200 (+) Transcript_150462:1289-1888(+)
MLPPAMHPSALGARGPQRRGGGQLPTSRASHEQDAAHARMPGLYQFPARRTTHVKSPLPALQSRLGAHSLEKLTASAAYWPCWSAQTCSMGSVRPRFQTLADAVIPTMRTEPLALLPAMPLAPWKKRQMLTGAERHSAECCRHSAGSDLFHGLQAQAWAWVRIHRRTWRAAAEVLIWAQLEYVHMAHPCQKGREATPAP